MILIRFGRTLNPNPRPHRHPPQHPSPLYRHPPLRLRPLQRRPPAHSHSQHPPAAPAGQSPPLSPIKRAAPPAAAFPTPAQNPTPSFLQRLREERERLGKD
ncbi:hypothetical protein NW826_13175 [Synechococcus sp. OH20]